MKEIIYTCDFGSCEEKITGDSRVTIDGENQVLHFHESCWRVARELIKEPEDSQVTFE